MTPTAMAYRIALAAALAAALAGCATIEYGADDAVPVVTGPPGATVVSSTGTVCVSPCTVIGRRKDNFTVTITKPGFVPQTVVSASKPTAGIDEATRVAPSLDYLGRIIDAQDGSRYEHVPAALIVSLQPVK